MKLVLNSSFTNKFLNQIDYISDDKPKAAKKFKNDVLALVRQTVKMPYKHRQSVHFKNSNVREFTFKGYLIIYRIKPEQNEIEVFGFIKYTQEP